MKRILQLGSLVLAMLLSINTYATQDCSLQHLAEHPHQVLECYINQLDVGAPSYTLESSTHDTKNNVWIEKYTLTSQVWPKTWMSAHSILWKHTLTIYRPDQFESDHALLVIFGGTRNSDLSKNDLKTTRMNLMHAATESHTVAAILEDEPNQYLTFDDGVARKEDGIIAYSWTQFLNDPYHNAYWPAHIPMTSAAVKTMDAIQEIIAAKTNQKINHFVVAGASKRGWATWLTALSDDRVAAIVPVVIDTLDTVNTMHHIYESYNHQWPIAMQDYVEQKVADRIDTPEFAQLMQIEDPLTYLQGDNNEVFKKRLSIPKYIISSSGDDFFVPDSMNGYIGKLPGETDVRVVPNQNHNINLILILDALVNYYHALIHNTVRPHINWTLDSEGSLASVVTTQEPVTVKLWEAENPDTRDFRYASGIRYQGSDLPKTCADNQCSVTVNIKPPVKGFKADFIELAFQNKDGTTIKLTTPVYIIAAKNSP